MANPWFRMYSEFADDSKVQMLSEVDQRRLVMIFCLQCKEHLGTLHETEIAFHLRIMPLELQASKEIFIEKGFIDEKWNVLNWNRRQFLSDSSTDRVRKFRRKKQDETLLWPKETVQNRTDTEAETEKPSREKTPRAPTKSNLIKQRHAEFKAKIKQYWEFKNPGVEIPWGPSEGKQLAMWLAESPLTTVEQFTEYLRNRARSDINHAERPSRWVGNITSYANGPLNTFRQPMNGGKKNGKIENNASSFQIAANDILREGEDGGDYGKVGGDNIIPGGGSESSVFEAHGATIIDGES
jgi:hypothetical protein